jgi:hypothetical protein
MHIVQHVPRRMQRRMYSPLDRRVVSGVGLGEVDGLFNIGKMFSRLTHVTPRSFQFKNIAGAIGSAAMFSASAGLSTLAPKLTGAHSTLSKDVGYGVMAAAAVAGAVFAAPVIGGALGIGGTAATGTGLVAGAEAAEAGGMLAAGTGVLAPAAEASVFAAPSVISTGSTLMSAGSGVLAPVASAGGGFLSTVGSVLSTVGTGALNVLKAVPLLGTVMGAMGGGGGGGVVVQTGGDPYAQQQAQAELQAAYDARIAAAQNAMYIPGGPGGYAPNIPYTTPSYSGPVSAGPVSADNGYGDLRSPYTLTSEDGSQQVQVDPKTGQVVQAGMLPDLSPTTWLMIGGVTLLGWYFMSGSKSTSTN